MPLRRKDEIHSGDLKALRCTSVSLISKHRVRGEQAPTSPHYKVLKQPLKIYSETHKEWIMHQKCLFKNIFPPPLHLTFHSGFTSFYIPAFASPIFLSTLHLLSVLLHPALAVRATVISVMSSKGKCLKGGQGEGLGWGLRKRMMFQAVLACVAATPWHPLAAAFCAPKIHLLYSGLSAASRRAWAPLNPQHQARSSSDAVMWRCRYLHVHSAAALVLHIKGLLLI